jgi:hypothetical protein
MCDKEPLMVERICPACRYGNTVDSHYCAKCGAALERLLPAGPREPTALTIAGRSLPVSWKQVGRTVAIGAAAMAAEAGLVWLRRRLEGGQPAPLARNESTLPTPAGAARSITTIVSQRVIEIIEGSDGRRTITDRHLWRKIDE